MMKPFIIEKDTHNLILICSKGQLDDIHTTPCRFMDELNNELKFSVESMYTMNQYIHECGLIVKSKIVMLEIHSQTEFERHDAEYILNSYKTIINKHYRTM